MTDITRINLVGQQRPWWNTGITMGEVRAFGQCANGLVF